MKYLLVLFAAVILFACRDSTVQTSPRPRLVHKDSLPKNSNNPYAPIDLSPMDMSYLPVDYPKMLNRNKLPVARVIYSRPHKQDRKIFGELVKYGEPWRLGANEATEIEFFQQVTVGGQKINKGRYTMYCLPQENKWTIVFNSDLFNWGIKQDSTKDQFRVDANISTLKNQTIEYFTIVFQQTAKGADLVMAWDDVEGRLPVEYIQQ